MFAYLKAELKKHGFEADDHRLHNLLDVDVELNTMGLEHWLDHFDNGSQAGNRMRSPSGGGRN
jgi:hypothetical protein